MKKALRKRLEAVALILALCALCLAPASATNSSTYDTVKDKDCSLTIEYTPETTPMANNTFRIWKVGQLSDRGCLPLRDVLGYNVLQGEGSWWTKASTLLGYLQRDNVAPTDTAQTGADGKVSFKIEAADQGLYLVAGDSQYRGGTRYTPTPFLILVPHTTDLQVWDTSVETHSKFGTYTPGGGGRETVQRHVLKSWNDEGHEDERPASITVDLLRDGQVDRSATLTADNNWRCDWTGLDARYQWTVVERENEQYAVEVEQEGITFHITNSWLEEIDPDDPPLIDIPDLPDDPDTPDTPDNPDNPDTPDIPENPDNPDTPDVPDNPDTPDTPDNPDDPGLEDNIPDADVPLDGLPQTGQLWWPVAPLVMGGLVFLLIGWKRRRDWRKSDEA